MTIAEYIQWTNSTAVYPPERREEYLQLGLLSELGEVAALLKREIRDDVPVDRAKLVDELGDVLWYLVQLLPGSHFWTDWKSPNWGNRRDIWDLLGMAIQPGASTRLAVPSLLIFLQNRGISLDEVIDANVAKLESRKERGVLKGAGGER